MRAVTIRADEIRVGDRPTEWSGPWLYGPAEGPGERVTEIARPGDGSDRDPEDAGMVEAWTDTGVVAGLPAITCHPAEPVTVWREVGA